MKSHQNTPKPESAADFHQRYARWVKSDPLAKRWDAQRMKAKKNRSRKKLSDRRKNYWGAAQTRAERRLMRRFHTLP